MVKKNDRISVAVVRFSWDKLRLGPCTWDRLLMKKKSKRSCRHPSLKAEEEIFVINSR